MHARHRGKDGRFASGGKVHEFPKDSLVLEEAKDKSNDFNKGGKVKKKFATGGKIGGTKGHFRLDKKPRFASGGKVHSSARNAKDSDTGGYGFDLDGTKTGGGKDL